MMLDFRTQAMQWLSYEPDTGKFIWLISPNGGRCIVKAGDQAGTLKEGYVKIRVLGQQWRAHRLAWLFQTGEVPPKGLDVEHANRKRDDNRWSNLRLATRSQNNMNMLPSVSNKSGFRGVSWRADTNKWHARIVVENRTILLGDFVRIEDAVAARKKAEAHYCGNFAPK